jgi:hypothetical protein
MLEGLIDCYREVFGAEPWNEWKKCPICETKWGITEAGPPGYIHCGIPIVDFWPRDQVREDIYHEINPESSCWLAIEDNGSLSQNKVIGFCWGYPIRIDELEKKLLLPGLKKSVIRKFGKIEGKIAYQDELGLISSYRGRKVAKKMFTLRLRDFLDQGLPIGIVRTKSNPPTVTYLWFLRIGYEVVAEYNDLDGRVVLARSYEDIGQLLGLGSAILKTKE